MGKRLAMIVTLLALALLAAPGAKAEGVKRALVMGFDTFQSQPSTTPSSANNVTLMANALSGGSMNLYQLVTHLDDLATTEAFAQAVQEAFDGATDEDINYFYISTHGVWQEGMSNGALQHYRVGNAAHFRCRSRHQGTADRRVPQRCNAGQGCSRPPRKRLSGG